MAQYQEDYIKALEKERDALRKGLESLVNMSRNQTSWWDIAHSTYLTPTTVPPLEVLERKHAE